MKKIKLFLAAFAAMVTMGVNAQTWTGNEPAAGTFYLYNVGAAKFINNGDPAQEWGTNAYLQAGFGLDFVLEANGTAYNLNTNVSNGGNNNYLGTSTWCDGAATPWTFTAVDGQEKTYTISNGSSYLVANDALNDIVYGASTGDSKSYWKLVSEDDFKTAMQAKTYSTTDPMDVSIFIKGRSFARNDGRNSSWTTTHNGGNWTWIGGSNNKYYGNESWNNTFEVSQTITGLPDGTYEVQCSGFGTNGTTYIYGNTTSKTLQTDNTTERGTNAAAKWIAIHEDNAFAGQTTGTFTLSGGELTVGLKRTTNKGGDWCIWDEFRLYYYGLDLSEFAAALANAVSAAQATQGTVPTACYNAINAVVEENNKAYSTAAEYTAATNAINTAVSTYASTAIVSNYSRYKTVRTAALAINPDLDVTDTDEMADAATTAEEVASAVAALRSAFVAAIGDVEVPEDPGYIDVTAVMVDNASVSENTNYWTIEGTPNPKYSWGVCNYGECEFYQQNFKFYQTLAMARGTWEFGVTGFHRAGNHSTYFYAGEDKILIPGVESSVVNSMAQAKDYFDAGNGKVSLKFIIESASNIEIGIDNTDTQTDKWTIFRNFTLKYYGAPDYSVYVDQWNTAYSEAGAARTTHPNITGIELSNLNAAMNDAPDGSSKANYLEKIQALQTATNTFTAAAPSYDKYTAYRTETVNLFGEELANTVSAPTTAAEAITAVQNLNIAQYNKVTDEYQYSLNGLIGDFGSWTATATVAGEPGESNYLTNEHWSGTTHAYYEQDADGWGNANGWTIQYEKKCTLPAGNYVIKVAARTSAGTTSLVSCSATETTISLPCEGAASKGITTEGVASFNEEAEFANNGTGFGWQWRFLPFTLDEETEVTMTFYAEASTQYQWMSIADGELLSANDIATAVEYDEDNTNTIEAVLVANVTMSRTIKEGFNTVALPFTLTANQVTAAFGTGTVVYNYTEASDDSDNVTIYFTAGDGSITANKPVLVKAGAASTEQSFDGVKIVAPDAQTGAKVAGKNFDFKGVYAPGEITAGDWFIGNGALYQSTGSTSIKAFRAFIEDKNPETGVKALTLNIDGITTGIATIKNGEMNIEEGAIYNIAGQRLSKLQKGLNIVNGKKYLVK